MARQLGPIYLEGTIDDITFYKMKDGYYAKKKSKVSPSVKKQMRDPRYYQLLQMRRSAFRKASQLASQVYRTLPRATRELAWYRALVKVAIPLVWQATAEAAILEVLFKEVKVLQGITEKAADALFNQTTIVDTPIQEPFVSIQPSSEAPVEKKPARQGKAATQKKLTTPLLWVSPEGVMYRLGVETNEVLQHLPLPVGGALSPWDASLFRPSLN
jgi:hypothetical protein